MNASLLVNTLGHTAGVLVFSIFLYLLIQDRAARRPRGGLQSMLAAALALAWNAASLLLLTMGDQGQAWVLPTVAISFSVLTLLPAVLFDLALAGESRWLTRSGYVVSITSIVLHWAELALAQDVLHNAGLELITAAFGALTVIAALRLRRTRLVATMSLFLLAMSFVHLGSGHGQQLWSQELAFHHAAIPLALLILLQDYRFVLLDAFLRFLANVLLAGLFVGSIAAAWQYNWLPEPRTSVGQALLLTAACLLLVLYALTRSGLQRALTRILFHRRPDQSLLRVLKTPVRQEREYLERAPQFISAIYGASVSITELPELDDFSLLRPLLVAELPRRVPSLESSDVMNDVEVVVPLRLPAASPRYLLLGRRAGGRRYLSEDLEELSAAAALIAEQVDQHREAEMRRLMAQAELRALQSQIHPHFLFNAFNTLYGLIPGSAQGARDTVLNLADIFRYFLETKKAQVPFEEEMHIVRAYLDVERLRLGDKLQTEFRIAPEALSIPIPILSVQPLVENAVKHAIAPFTSGGRVTLEASVDPSGQLSVRISDTGPGFGAKRAGGVGLENVTRRLELSYGADARIDIQSSASGSTVQFCIPVDLKPRSIEVSQ